MNVRALKTSAALPARRRLPAFKHERCDGAAQAKQPAHLATPNASGSNALARELWKSPGANSAWWEGGREGGSKKVFSFPLFALYVCIQLCAS